MFTGRKHTPRSAANHQPDAEVRNNTPADDDERYAPNLSEYDTATLARVTVTTGTTTHRFYCYEEAAVELLEVFSEYHANWQMLLTLPPSERVKWLKAESVGNDNEPKYASGFTVSLVGAEGLIVRRLFISVAPPNAFIQVDPVYDDEVQNDNSAELLRFRSSLVYSR